MKQNLKAYLVAYLDHRGQPTHFTVQANKMEGYVGFACISELEVEVEVPDDFNFTAAAVDKLQAQKQLVRAKALRDVQDLDTQIQELQALEMA